MTWLYILLDALILTVIVLICVLIAFLWTKKSKINVGSLAQFRNDDIYEKSLQDKKRLAHIEDVVSDIDNEEVETIPDETDKEISYSDIDFSEGYGSREEDGHGD